MSDRGATPPIPGLLTSFVDVAQTVAYFDSDNTLTRASFRVTDAPSSGSVTVELNTESDGTGDGIEVTITDGTTFATATGSVSIPAGSYLYQIVTAESGAAMSLSGEYEIESASGYSTSMTTLARVWRELNITSADASRDLLINDLIAGVSRQMQDWIGRPIVQSTITDERIDSDGGDTIQTHEYPIISVTTLTEGTEALVEDTDFELQARDLDRGQIVRISGTDPIGWQRGRRVVNVTYVTGYAAVPPSLVDAATALVTVRYNETKKSGSGWRGLASKGVDPASSTAYDKELWTRETIPAMQPYRRQVA